MIALKNTTIKNDFSSLREDTLRKRGYQRKTEAGGDNSPTK